MKNYIKKHMEAYQFIWQSIIIRHYGYFLWSLFSVIIGSLIGVLLPYLAKIELDQLSEKYTHLFGYNFGTPIIVFFIILSAVFFMDVIQGILDFLFGLKTKIQKGILDSELKREIFSRIYLLDPGYTLMQRFQRMISAVTGVINNIPFTLETFFKSYIGASFELISIGIVASFFDYKIFLIILLASSINYGINRYSEFYRRKHELSANYEIDWEIHSIERAIEESYHHIASNGATDMLFDRYFELKNNQILIIKKREKIDFFTRIIEQWVTGIATICVKILVGYIIFSGSGSLGLMTMSTMYMSRIESITKSFFRAFTDRYEVIENISILQFFLNFIKEKLQIHNENLTFPIKNITLKNLYFSYPKPAQAEVEFLQIKIATLKKILKEKYNEDYFRDELHTYEIALRESKKENPIILHGVNMIFEAGKLYGIIGKNGAGKSTLTSLLLGFFSEYTGSIKINENEVNTIKRDNIQKNIGYISQEPYLMTGRFSIRDNLLLGVQRKVDDTELLEYLERFGMKEKILREREGLNTKLGWDMDLSGGQKQILVLIRIILQDRPILILDEGTNQLDAENEGLVMNELLKNRKDKIIIFVTHRMNTMKKCDYLYTLVDGKIEDCGNPRELITRNNMFKKFIELGEQKL